MSNLQLCSSRTSLLAVPKTMNFFSTLTFKKQIQKSEFY